MPLAFAVLLSIALNFLLLALMLRRLVLLYKLARDRRRQRYVRCASHFSIKPVTSHDIIFLGDSITENVEWRALLPQASLRGFSVRNFGIGSDTTAGVLARLKPVVNGQPRAIFLLIGTNDIGFGLPHTETLANYTAIVEQVSTKMPDSTLYIQSILPRQGQDRALVEALNQQLRILAKNHQATYIDLYTSFIDEDGGLKDRLSNDNLHLLGRGYRYWQQLIAPYVEAVL